MTGPTSAAQLLGLGLQKIQQFTPLIRLITQMQHDIRRFGIHRVVRVVHFIEHKNQRRRLLHVSTRHRRPMLR